MKTTWSFVIVILFLFMSPGCAGPRRQMVETMRGSDFRVSLEQKVENGEVIRGRFAHPGDISEHAIVFLLEELVYLDKSPIMGTPVKAAVFTKTEVSRLAPAICTAIHKADSGQWVRFLSIGREQGLVFKKKLKTEGVFFVDPNGSINVVFLYIKEPVPIDGPPALAFSRREPFEHDPAASECSLVVEKGYMRYHKENGRVFHNWIEIDGTALFKEAEKTVKEGGTAVGVSKGEPAPGEPLPARSREIKKDWNTEEQRIWQRLKFLKSLYEEELITREEYEKRKKELLDKIE